MSRRRRLLPDLPRGAWGVLGGDAVAALGTGLTLPYLIVYLHDVRGVGLGLAALAVSTIAAAGLVGNPLGGWLADRAGARAALIWGLAATAAGTAALAGVRGPLAGFAAVAVVGLGRGVAWPAVSSLLGGLVSPERRSAVFAVRFALLNAGFAVGGLTAAAIVDPARPATFELIYLLDAALTLAFAVALTRLRRLSPPRPASAPKRPRRGGYRTVLGDRRFLRVWALMALLVAAGYAQLNAAFPIFAIEHGGVGAGGLGLLLAANTVTVVIGQLVVLRLMEGRRRSRGVAAVCACWAAAWVLTLAAAAVPGGGAALASLAGAMVVFALGETLVAPTLPAMVNDLAGDALRGRYNGAFALAWTMGFLVGPAVAGAILATGAGETLFAGLIVALGVGAFVALRLERHVPAEANVVGRLPRRSRRGVVGEPAALAA